MSLIGFKRYREREEVDDASLPAFLRTQHLLTEAEKVMLNRMDAIRMATVV